MQQTTWLGPPALSGDYLQSLLLFPLGCTAWLPSLHSSSSLPAKAPGLGQEAVFSCGGQELSCLQLAAALERCQLPLMRSAEAQAPAVAARDALAAPSCGDGGE